jgi:hypothetical protein
MNKLPPLPEPSLLKLPDDGEGYSDEAPYIWAWFAHGYDTGMTPYFSDDQMNAFAQLAADHALEEAAKAAEDRFSDGALVIADAIRAMKGKP